VLDALRFSFAHPAARANVRFYNDGSSLKNVQTGTSHSIEQALCHSKQPGCSLLCTRNRHQPFSTIRNIRLVSRLLHQRYASAEVLFRKLVIVQLLKALHGFVRIASNSRSVLRHIVEAGIIRDLSLHLQVDGEETWSQLLKLCRQIYRCSMQRP
jgi:hypothetical protein